VTDTGSAEHSEPAEDGTWLLQADAAAAAGCSVSAIRKWRRLGVVADRTRGSHGLQRVEVRLEDVVARMQESIALQAPGPNSRAAPAEPVATVVPVSELEVFVRHIADAERRAAQMEAQLQANETMLQFLRDRVAQLQAQLEAEPARTSVSRRGPQAEPDPSRLAAELRQLRQRLRNDRTADAAQRAAGVAGYDAALLTACAAYGLPTTSKLGDRLAASERRRLTEALAQAGVDVRD
jgi:hypothetical protein